MERIGPTLLLSVLVVGCGGPQSATDTSLVTSTDETSRATSTTATVPATSTHESSPVASTTTVAMLAPGQAMALPADSGWIPYAVHDRVSSVLAVPDAVMFEVSPGVLLRVYATRPEVSVVSQFGSPPAEATPDGYVERRAEIAAVADKSVVYLVSLTGQVGVLLPTERLEMEIGELVAAAKSIDELISSVPAEWKLIAVTRSDAVGTTALPVSYVDESGKRAVTISTILLAEPIPPGALSLVVVGTPVSTTSGLGVYTPGATGSADFVATSVDSNTIVSVSVLSDKQVVKELRDALVAEDLTSVRARVVSP